MIQFTNEKNNIKEEVELKKKKMKQTKTPPMFIIYLRRFDKRLVWGVTGLLSLLLIFLLVLLVANIFKKAVVFTIRGSNTVYSTTKKANKDYTQDIYDMLEKLNQTNYVDALGEFENLAIVKCDSFINLRSSPDVKDTRAIVGKMYNNSACDILQMDVNETYSKVKSGNMTGYVAKQFLITGDEAKQIALQNVKERAEIQVAKLWMRSEPNATSEDNKIGATYKGERFVIVDRVGEWLKIEADDIDGYSFGYINGSSDYVTIKKCLDVARTQDLKNDVLNYYDTIGVSIANSFVNIRSSAKDKGNSNIIGKLPRHAGCEILSSTGDWYKIRSGRITGYVTKDYIATGKKAENLAVQYADLRAIVKIDALRVRTKASTKAKAWTTISKEETYVVKDQLDGWVEIEIEGGRKNESGFISTSQGYVEVRYALEQAVEYRPAQVQQLKVTSKRKSVITYATQFVGNPYVWGGTSLTGGADCSGFVQSIMRKYGVSLPRVAKDQAKCGVARTSATKQPGDLIFYSGPTGVIDHVAIYIGNNQIVHAASAKSGIKISRWNYRAAAAIRNVLGN